MGWWQLAQFFRLQMGWWQLGAISPSPDGLVAVLVQFSPSQVAIACARRTAQQQHRTHGPTAAPLPTRPPHCARNRPKALKEYTTRAN